MKIEEKPDLSWKFFILPSWTWIMSSYVISRNGQTNLDKRKSDLTRFPKHELNRRREFSWLQKKYSYYLFPMLSVLMKLITFHSKWDAKCWNHIKMIIFSVYITSSHLGIQTPILHLTKSEIFLLIFIAAGCIPYIYPSSSHLKLYFTYLLYFLKSIAQSWVACRCISLLLLCNKPTQNVAS